MARPLDGSDPRPRLRLIPSIALLVGRPRHWHSRQQREEEQRASYLAWIGRTSLPKGSCLLDLLLSLISCNFLFGSCNRQHGTVQYRRSCCKFSFCVLGLIIIWCYEWTMRVKLNIVSSQSISSFYLCWKR
jgi:hypothetical protein